MNYFSRGHTTRKSTKFTLWQVVTCYLFLTTISMQKMRDIDCFVPEILVIKESNNLIGQEHILVCNLKLRVLYRWKNTFAYLQIN